MNTQDRVPNETEKNMKPDSFADSENAGSDQEQTKNNSAADTTTTGGAKRRIIDESLLDENEAQRLEARRAYNRQCASKARKRSKDLIATLQQQVEELSKDKASLERNNEVMHAQLSLFEQQNRSLMMNQRVQSAPVMPSGAGSRMGGMGGMQMQMQGQAGSQFAQGAGSFPSVSLLDSLSAQGRLAGLQGENQQGGMLAPGLPFASASVGGGSGGLDHNKYYFG
jgi:hypothetical protein